MNKFKRWVFFFIVGSFSLFGTIVFFNYYVDTFSLFRKSGTSMADDMINGYYISGNNISSNRVENIYEPIIKKLKYVDVLAIGSSRTMLLHKNLLFDNDKIVYYNFTDGTANLNHYAKIIGLFNKYHIKLPKKIILGIDPWVFDKSVSLSRIKRLMNNADVEKSKYLQLFNFEYTVLNIKSLFAKKRYNKSKNLDELLNINNKNITISPNGDLYNPMFAYNIKPDELMSKEKTMLKKCDETNYNTKCVNYKKLTNFNKLKYIIDYLRAKGVKVIIYLSPFEPNFFDHIVKYNRFKSYDVTIATFLKTNDLKIIGSYNPYDYNLTTADFLDGIHPKESAIKSIFDKEQGGF